MKVRTIKRENSYTMCCIVLLLTALPILLCSAQSSTTPEYPLTTDNACGEGIGRRCLTNGTNPCCSTDGFCGNNAEYCGSGCQEDYGTCTAYTSICGWPEVGGPRCDGRCGSAYNNAPCNSTAGPNDLAKSGVFDYGPCCSSGGYELPTTSTTVCNVDDIRFCGNSDAHCGRTCQSGCDEGYGPDSTSSATTSSGTASQSTPPASTPSDGLPTNTKVGIGVGLGGGAIVAITFLVWYYLHHRKKSHRREEEQAYEIDGVKKDQGLLAELPPDYGRTELEAPSQIHELHHNREPVELPGS